MARTLAMFTDTSLCIGCRACQVACKQWNELPTGGAAMDRRLPEPRPLHRQDLPARALHREAAGRTASWQWLLMSDVCKHCAQAGCLDACPTGAIYRTEFGTVNINQDVCNGCRYCVSSCPFGVVSFNRRHRPRQQVHVLQRPHPQRARPRLRQGVPDRVHPVRIPRRAGREGAEARGQAQGDGLSGAQLYGVDAKGPLGGLNAFFLLLDKPSTYDLPEKPLLPQRNVLVDSLLAVGSALLVGVGALMAFRERGGQGDDHA